MGASHDQPRTIISWFCLYLSFLLPPAAAPANIDLQWRPADQTVQPGNPVSISLFAVSDDPQRVQLLSAMDVVFSWQPQFLRLDGLTQSGAVPLLYSGFPPNDPSGLNEIIPPADGDGLYQALARLGQPVEATPQGTLMTTFLFTALAPTAGTDLLILPAGGSPPTRTVVWDGTVPNHDVTGLLGSATVRVVPEPSSAVLLAVGVVACVSAPRRKRPAADRRRPGGCPSLQMNLGQPSTGNKRPWGSTHGRLFYHSSAGRSSTRTPPAIAGATARPGSSAPIRRSYRWSSEPRRCRMGRWDPFHRHRLPRRRSR